eukprot:EG_transcript_408
MAPKMPVMFSVCLLLAVFALGCRAEGSLPEDPPAAAAATPGGPACALYHFTDSLEAEEPAAAGAAGLPPELSVLGEGPVRYAAAPNGLAAFLDSGTRLAAGGAALPFTTSFTLGVWFQGQFANCRGFGCPVVGTITLGGSDGTYGYLLAVVQSGGDGMGQLRLTVGNGPALPRTVVTHPTALPSGQWRQAVAVFAAGSGAAAPGTLQLCLDGRCVVAPVASGPLGYRVGTRFLVGALQDQPNALVGFVDELWVCNGARDPADLPIFPAAGPFSTSFPAAELPSSSPEALGEPLSPLPSPLLALSPPAPGLPSDTLYSPSFMFPDYPLPPQSASPANATVAPAPTATLTPTPSGGGLVTSFLGPRALYPTLAEVGTTPCTWWLTLANLSPANRTVSLVANDIATGGETNSLHFIFRWSSDLQPLPRPLPLGPASTAAVCIGLGPPALDPASAAPLPLSPQKLTVEFMAVDGAGRAVTRPEPVTVYVLPEPRIAPLETEAGARVGDGAEEGCRLVHAAGQPLTVQIVLAGDSSNATLFRAVEWAVTPAGPTLQGSPAQRLVTLPADLWATVRNITLTARVTLGLPNEDSEIFTVQRQCQVVVNAGPNGSAANFSFVGILGGLVPLERYEVEITGWVHWTDSMYSMWAYFASDPSQVYRLSADSNATLQTISIPFVGDGDQLVVFCQATDAFFSSPVPCAACARPVPVAQPAAVPTALRALTLAEAPLATVGDLLAVLATTARLAALPEAVQSALLGNVRTLAAQTDPAVLLQQTAPSWAATLGGRGPVDGFDRQVVALLLSLAKGPGVLATPGVMAGLLGVLGSVLRREAATPTATETGASGSASASKFFPLNDAGAPTAESLRGDVLELAQRRAAVSPFRQVDCATSTEGAGAGCVAVCTLRCYREDLTSNLTLLVPDDPERLSADGRFLLQWVIRNRGWLGRISRPYLPDIVAVASARVALQCTHAGPAPRPAGLLVRVLLVDPATGGGLAAPVAGYEVAVPLTVAGMRQYCTVLPDQGDGDGLWHSVPRSPLYGHCLVDDISVWVSTADSPVYAAGDSSGLIFVLIGIIAGGLTLLCLNVLCCYACSTLRRRPPPPPCSAAAAETADQPLLAAPDPPTLAPPFPTFICRLDDTACQVEGRPWDLQDAPDLYRRSPNCSPQLHPSMGSPAVSPARTPTQIRTPRALPPEVLSALNSIAEGVFSAQLAEVFNEMADSPMAGSDDEWSPRGHPRASGMPAPAQDPVSFLMQFRAADPTANPAGGPPPAPVGASPAHLTAEAAAVELLEHPRLASEAEAEMLTFQGRQSPSPVHAVATEPSTPPSDLPPFCMRRKAAQRQAAPAAAEAEPVELLTRVAGDRDTDPSEPPAAAAAGHRAVLVRAAICFVAEAAPVELLTHGQTEDPPPPGKVQSHSHTSRDRKAAAGRAVGVARAEAEPVEMLAPIPSDAAAAAAELLPFDEPGLQGFAATRSAVAKRRSSADAVLLADTATKRRVRFSISEPGQLGDPNLLSVP